MSALTLPATPTRNGKEAPVWRLLPLLTRPGAQGVATLALPFVAFAVATGLLLIVVAGTVYFWTELAHDGVYPMLSALACALLVVPLVALSGVAARLSARRRDDRLATLRLLGASTRTVTALTIIESTAIAFAGALAGVVLYVALVPLTGLLHFNGGAIGMAALWLHPGVIAAVLLLVIIVAAVSAALGLRKVRITPLGVRARTDAPKPNAARVFIAVAVIIAAIVAVSFVDGSAAVIVTVICVAIGSAVAIVNLLGPWLLGVIGRVQLRRARTAESLIAARSVLEDPKAAWRAVSGLAMTTFVAVIGGAGMAFISGGDGSGDPLIDDIRTGVLLTLAISFLMVACSVGLNQAAQILDRRALWVALDRAGMPRETMDRARRGAVLLPLGGTVAVSAGVALALVLPLAGTATVFAPMSVLVVVGCFALGFSFVLAALAATKPVLGHVLTDGQNG